MSVVHFPAAGRKIIGPRLAHDIHLEAGWEQGHLHLFLDRGHGADLEVIATFRDQGALDRFESYLEIRAQELLQNLVRQGWRPPEGGAS